MKDRSSENEDGNSSKTQNSSQKKGDKTHRYSAGRSSKNSGNSKGQNHDLEEKKSSNGSEEEKNEQEPTGSEDGEKEMLNDVDKDIENEGPDPEEDEEEKIKEREEEQRRQLEEEKKQAEDLCLQCAARIEFRRQMFAKNMSASVDHRPDEAFFKKLDSSMKKNTSFVKKLRMVTEQQRQQLENEFNGLNLTKYIQEVATALAEAKLKASDVSCAAFMCSLIHQRYADFTPLLKNLLMKGFESFSCKEEEKVANVAKFRSSLRLLVELVLDGVIAVEEGMKFICSVVSSMVNTDKVNHTYAPVLLSLARHCGEDLAGLQPRQQRVWKEKFNIDFPQYEVIPEGSKTALKNMWKEYYASLAKHLVRDHKDLQNRERQNRQTIGLKGELPPERKEAFEKAQKTYEKLLANATTLAEILDEELPDLPEDFPEEKEDLMTINIYTPGRGGEYDAEHGLWEDEDTRTFYENIKDLKSLVPQILFKEKEGKPTAKQKEANNKRKQRKLRNDINLDDDLADALSDDDKDFDYENEILADDDDDEPTNNHGGSSMASIVEAYLQKLTTCVNRDFIDEAAEEFLLQMNTKGNRKKLVRALFTVNRIRLDLLPFYARLVATLSPCLPDIGQDLVYLLKGDFRFHVRKKDQINLESKIKTVRFIGELTKFRVCPKAESLHCLKMLLENFTHHNIDMTCHLLETCGRFLYRSPESNPRTSSLLDQMMRKKTVQAFDSRQTTMIENAFYHCNPPDRPKVQRKVRPPLHEYIRKLLYKDLSKTTTEKVLRQMRKLPWDDPEVMKYAGKCLLHVWSIKYNNIHCAANLLSGLTEYYDDLGTHVVDGLLESIRVGMETNFPRYNQRRVSCVKYLGELYNYQLIESDVIFNVLYSFLTFGKGADGSSTNLDPPDNLFRIRLICVLLDTCGQYFDRGSSKKKLDCFLVYFQAYIWAKKQSDCWNDSCPFPREVDYQVSDTIEALRPSLRLFADSEEALEAVEKLDKEYQAKFESLLRMHEPSLQSDPSTPVDPLNLPLPGTGTPGSPWDGSQFSVSPSVQSLSSAEDDTDGDAGTEEDMDAEEEEEEGDAAEQTGDPMFALEEDEAVKLKEGPRLIQCEEDDCFRSAYEKLVVDTFQQRLSEAMKTPVVDIAIPMHLKGNAKKTLQNDSKVNDANFVLLVKKGNKQQYKGLNVPAESGLAANIRDKQLAEKAEHEEMKRLVLDYNKRQEEEAAYNEMMQNTQQWKGYHQPYRGGGRHRNYQRLRVRDHEQQFHSSSGRSIRR